MKHLTTEVLLELIDGRLSEERAGIAESHLRDCRSCEETYESLQEVDRSLVSIPLDRAGDELTGAVLQRIGVVPDDPLLFRFLEKSAHFIGLGIVVAVMLTVFGLAGVIEIGADAEGSWIQNFTGGRIGPAVSTMGQWLITHIPFSLGEGTLGITAAILLVLSVIGLVDRFLQRRFLSS